VKGLCVSLIVVFGCLTVLLARPAFGQAGPGTGVPMGSSPDDVGNGGGTAGALGAAPGGYEGESEAAGGVDMSPATGPVPFGASSGGPPPTGNQSQSFPGGGSQFPGPTGSQFPAPGDTTLGGGGAGTDTESTQGGSGTGSFGPEAGNPGLGEPNRTGTLR